METRSRLPLRRMVRCLTIATTALIANWSGSAVVAQDFAAAKNQNWHQWRGPEATGFAQHGDPPTEWSNQNNIKWKTPIVGEGSSVPIVWENQVFILSAIETNQKSTVTPPVDAEAMTVPPDSIFQFVVWSFDRNTGDVLWKKVVNEAAPHEGRHSSTTYAAGSPVTDGQRIYASFGSYGVYCLTMKGGLIWKKDLGDMRTRRGWGEGVSPVIHDGKLIVNWDQEDASEIFVLNAEDGSLIWKRERDEPTSWATPLVANVNGVDQLITNGFNAVRSYDLATGDLIWEGPGTTLNAIPSPVVFEDTVILMSGYQGNLALAIDLNSKGKIDRSDVGPDRPIKWKFAQDTPYVPSPLLVQGRLYFTKSNNAVLSCLDARSGKPVYGLTRLPTLKSIYASPVAAADRVYLTSREGMTLVIRNSDKFEVIATNRLNEEIDASPAIVGNQLFLRGKKHLYCIQSTK